MKIAIVGGTGRMGMGLALRWAAAGHNVLIGSREEDKARDAAQDVQRRTGTTLVRGMESVQAVREADIAVVSVPYSAHVDSLRSICEAAQGKIVVDVCVPANPQNRRELLPVPAGSAVQEAQEILGSATPVVGAFHNVSFLLLQQYDQQVDCDVLVCGDSEGARATVMALVQDAGLRCWDAGEARHARTIEGLTALLSGLNSRYHSRLAGIQITNLLPKQSHQDA